ANQLTTVTAPSGRSLSFAYDSQNRVASVTAPDNAVTGYGYNSAGMLSSVTRPDGTTRQYVYEDSRFPTALTGIIDENGNRYATYAYDD
ncbi:RHS repeat protein, partial [Ralstonia solanacearum]|nr:RHS repeat protein [Ralstonia solanacearum]